MSRWTATTCVKLGSPQPVSCCPGTVCLPHFVHGIQGECPTSGLVAPHQAKQNIPALKLGTLNVRTMSPGLTGGLTDLGEAWKTALINNKLIRLNRHHSPSEDKSVLDCVREKGFMFIWHGKLPNEPREHCIGSPMRNKFLNHIMPPSEETKNIQVAASDCDRTNQSYQSLHSYVVISSKVKDKFYDDLSTAISRACEQEPLFILGDLNTRVGTNHSSWSSCLHQHLL